MLISFDNTLDWNLDFFTESQVFSREAWPWPCARFADMTMTMCMFCWQPSRLKTCDFNFNFFWWRSLHQVSNQNKHVFWKISPHLLGAISLWERPARQPTMRQRCGWRASPKEWWVGGGGVTRVPELSQIRISKRSLNEIRNNFPKFPLPKSLDFNQAGGC